MEEVAVYEVADGKIVREEFFYHMYVPSAVARTKVAILGIPSPEEFT